MLKEQISPCLNSELIAILDGIEENVPKHWTHNYNQAPVRMITVAAILNAMAWRFEQIRTYYKY